MRRLPFLLLALLLAACSSIDCPVNSLVQTFYKVCDSDGNEMKLTDTMSVISTRSDGTDTIIFNKGIGISEFHLDISYSHPEDILFFHFNNSNKGIQAIDTVWVKKEDYPHFESVDCNSAFFHTITNVRSTHNYIDSIVINNPSVTYDYETVHFRLYPKNSD